MTTKRDATTNEHGDENTEKFECPAPDYQHTYCQKSSLNRHMRDDHHEVADFWLKRRFG